MSIQNLKKVLSVPDVAYNTGNNNDWINFEKQLGSKLPNDYIEFVSTYGTGGIDEFLWFLNPFVKDENICFLKKYKIINDGYKETRLKFPKRFTYSVYPEPEGLLPWAYTDNGDVLYWITNQNSDRWQIIVYDARSPDFEKYNCSVVEFLHKLITKKLVCKLFPDDFPSDSPDYIAININ